MDGLNYRFPFDPTALMTENGSIENCDIAESIAQNIMLLIITKKGENRYDQSYGNDVWDIEFDNGVSTAAWENIFVNSLRRLITDYESRLVSPVVSAKVVFVEHNYDTRNFTEIKKKVKIVINAKLESTGERFNFATELFLSPMSID